MLVHCLSDAAERKTMSFEKTTLGCLLKKNGGKNATPCSFSQHFNQNTIIKSVFRLLFTNLETTSTLLILQPYKTNKQKFQ